MNKDQLPDELKEFSDVLEAFNLDRYLNRYLSSNQSQQQGFRMALWKARQSMEETQKELGVEDLKIIAELYKQVLPSIIITLPPADNSQE